MPTRPAKLPSRVTVEGVGLLSFPVSTATARALIGIARQAPYGQRERTLLDPRVRDTWEIDATRVHLDETAWKRTLDPQLALLGQALGLPRRGKLRAVLDKMLVYAPGQFFAAHQDSERADDMVGTLVVELPGRHQGGATVVKHGGEKQVFKGAKRAPRDLSLLAFYADCRHAFEPIKSGYRIVLTFRLHHPGGSSVETTPPDAAAIDRLTAAIKAHFATPIARPAWEKRPPEKPERLVYLLDHEYTQRSLSWDRLKNADRVRVAALREVASRLDCEVFLALAEVHENWQCEEDYEAHYGGYGRRDWDDEEYEEEDDPEDHGAGEVDEEGYELVDLVESEIALTSWIGPSGEEAPSVSTTAEDDEICFTLTSSDMKPWRSEYEGYMGNYGNTVERWYHRAALVMWPEDRSFTVRARVSPAWAVAELETALGAGDLADARAKAASLFPFWGDSAPREKREAFFRELCAVLHALDDVATAEALLAPFGLDRLSPGNTPAFVALVEQRGLAWSKRLLTVWRERDQYRTRANPPSLSGLCAALAASGATSGGALARWLLDREATAWITEHRQLHDEDNRWPADEDAQREEERNIELLALLDAARTIDAPSARDSLIEALIDPKAPLPIFRVGALLKRSRKDRTADATRSLGLGTLYRHIVSVLETALHAPPRREDDWSIEPPRGCKCELCAELARFLRAPDRREHVWPLAKERRRHVHNILDGHRLPVSHETLRTGSPQKLVLKKLPSLFARERKLRTEHAELLAWLRREGGWFDERG